MDRGLMKIFSDIAAGRTPSSGAVERRKRPQDWDRRIAPPRKMQPASKFGGATFEHFLHGTMCDQREGCADRRKAASRVVEA